MKESEIKTTAANSVKDGPFFTKRSSSNSFFQPEQTIQRQVDSKKVKSVEKLSISSLIASGSALSASEIAAVNEAAKKVPAQFRRCIVYENVIKVGGTLAWRANNPGNLRGASTKIAKVSGAVGSFAVFASMDVGRQAQKDLYINVYGKKIVTAAIQNLTPPSENDTTKYLASLKKAGVDINATVESQIEILMTAIEANEGMIAGIEIPRVKVGVPQIIPPFDF